MNGCSHHWQIERYGLVCEGKCHYCGEVRIFDNVLPFYKEDKDEFEGLHRVKGGVSNYGYIPVLQMMDNIVY